MHASVVFIDFGGISFRSKSGQTFFEDVHTERFIRSNANVNSQIELVAINQKGVRNITGNDGEIINVDIVDIINEVDSFSLSAVGWFNNPNVLLWVVLPQFLIMSVEFSELVREDVSVWNKVKVVLSVLLLHADDIATESIFPRDFVTLREMVDLLELVQTFINVGLAC